MLTDHKLNSSRSTSYTLALGLVFVKKHFPYHSFFAMKSLLCDGFVFRILCSAMSCFCHMHVMFVVAS